MCEGTYNTHTQTLLYMGLWASLTLPPQHKPSLGFLSHLSMGKTHIFITVEPVAQHNLFILSSSPLHHRVNHHNAVTLDLSLN